MTEDDPGDRITFLRSFADEIQLGQREAGLFAALPRIGDPQKLGEVPILRHRVPRYAVFIHQAERGLRVLPGAASCIRIVQTVLQVVHVEVVHGDGPERSKQPEAGAIAVHGALAFPVGGLPLIEEFLQRDGGPFALRGRAGARTPILRRHERQRGQGVFFRGEGPLHRLAPFVRHGARRRVRRQRIHRPRQRLDGDPPVSLFVNRTEAVAPAFCFAFRAQLLPAAVRTEDRVLRDLPGAFRTVAFHRGNLIRRPSSFLPGHRAAAGGR